MQLLSTHHVSGGTSKKKQHNSCLSTPSFVYEVHFVNLQTSDLDGYIRLKYSYLNDVSYTLEEPKHK